MLCALLCVAVVDSARAEADIGFKGVGGRLSLVFPSDIGTAFGFGGIVDLGTFAPQVAFGASLDIWWGSEASVDFRNIIIGANARYLFKVQSEKWKPYGGGGLAIHFLNASFASSSETDTKIGLDLLGGTNYEWRPNVDLIGEAMFRIVSDVNQFTLNVGAIYWFGKGAPADAEASGE
jgi:hypothetical protein